MNIEHHQLVSLNLEIKTAAKLIRLGLAELQQITFANYDVYLACLLLSSGYERLMKGIMCLRYLNDNMEFPPFDFLKDYGHNLVKLKDYILNNCITRIDNSDLKEDYKFLSEDKEIDQIIRILSDFAMKGRYFNLDVVVKNLKPTPNYQHEWSKNVSDYYIKKLNLSFDVKNTEMDNLNIKKVYFEVVKSLEKFTRALARQFVSSNLGEEARNCSVYYLPFLTLKNENLGKSDYSTKRFIIGT